MHWTNKMFLPMAETMTVLSKTEAEIWELNKQGKLREFRDGSRVMFKTAQVKMIYDEIKENKESKPEPPLESGSSDKKPSDDLASIEALSANNISLTDVVLKKSENSDTMSGILAIKILMYNDDGTETTFGRAVKSLIETAYRVGKDKLL